MTGRGSEISNQGPRFILPKNDGAFLLQGPSPMSFVLVQGQQYLIPISNELVGSFVQQTPTFSQANFLVSSAPAVINPVEKPEVPSEFQELPPALDKVSDEPELDENKEATVGFSCEKAFSKEADDFKRSVNADGIVLHQINGFLIEESERPLSPEHKIIKNYKGDLSKDFSKKSEEALKREKKKVTLTTAKPVASPVKRSERVLLESRNSGSSRKYIEKPKRRRCELTQLLNMDFGPKAGGRILLKANEKNQKKRRSYHDKPKTEFPETQHNVRSRRFSDIPTRRSSYLHASPNSNQTNQHSRPTRQTRNSSKLSISEKKVSNKKDINSNHSRKSVLKKEVDDDFNTDLSDVDTDETDPAEDEEREEQEDEEKYKHVEEKKPSRTLRNRERNAIKEESLEFKNAGSSSGRTEQSPKKIYYEPWGTPPYKVINVVNIVCSPGS